MAKRQRPELTHYSEKIPGATENHGWSVKFDKTSGTIGISQYDERDGLSDRVLLSRQQVKALQAFVAKRHR